MLRDTVTRTPMPKTPPRKRRQDCEDELLGAVREQAEAGAGSKTPLPFCCSAPLWSDKGWFAAASGHA
eukprot:5745357-Alexandrium_andersonii.AAC.1